MNFLIIKESRKKIIMVFYKNIKHHDYFKLITIISNASHQIKCLSLQGIKHAWKIRCSDNAAQERPNNSCACYLVQVVVLVVLQPPQTQPRYWPWSGWWCGLCVGPGCWQSFGRVACSAPYPLPPLPHTSLYLYWCPCGGKDEE